MAKSSKVVDQLERLILATRARCIAAGIRIMPMWDEHDNAPTERAAMVRAPSSWGWPSLDEQS